MGAKKNGEADPGDDRKDVVNEERGGTFTCNGDGCLVTERAEEMFNLSCDPLRVTAKELRPKVRCRRCAEDISRRRGKRLGEPGCGVYPLAQTLKTMERGAGAVPTVSDAPTYGCGHPGCTEKDRAEEMYNLQASLSASSNADTLAPLIRCRRHANEAAVAKGKAVCEPGSGVYRLSHTLKRMGIGPARSLREQQDNEYLKWVLETKNRRERDEREHRIREYAQAYAESSLIDEKDGAAVAPRSIGRDGQLYCGIPVDCCRHDAPTNRFMTVMGEVVGVCDLTARIFIDVHKANDGDQRYRRLLSTGDLQQAYDIAARWSGDDEDGSRRRRRRG